MQYPLLMVFPTHCAYDPTTVDGTVGQHHCPVCGDMQVAGIEHTGRLVGVTEFRCFPDDTRPSVGAWCVEADAADGAYLLTVFYGPFAEWRARGYASHQNQWWNPGPREDDDAHR